MTTMDWVAVALFALCWLGYEPLLAALARGRGSLNDDMLTVRRAWMQAMTRREMRLVDSQLMGHSINSASFFASANLLLIAAVAGVLFGGEAALRGVVAVGAEASSLRVLEAKLALITVCLARGFLDFTWSIRQMNYTLALIGAAPEKADDRVLTVFADASAAVLNPALNAFSRGVRAYYFALAAATWLFGAPWLAAGVLAVFVLLVWRQSRSPAACAIRQARALLEAPSSQVQTGDHAERAGS